MHIYYIIYVIFFLLVIVSMIYANEIVMKQRKIIEGLDTKVKATPAKAEAAKSGAAKISQPLSEPEPADLMDCWTNPLIANSERCYSIFNYLQPEQEPVEEGRINLWI